MSGDRGQWPPLHQSQQGVHSFYLSVSTVSLSQIQRSLSSCISLSDSQQDVHSLYQYLDLRSLSQHLRSLCVSVSGRQQGVQRLHGPASIYCLYNKIMPVNKVSF